MIYSFLDKVFYYEKCDQNSADRAENRSQSCSDSEVESEEISVNIGTSKITEAGVMRCRQFSSQPASGRIYFFRPSLLHLILLLFIILLVYSWIFAKVDKISQIRKKRPFEDSFDREITLFMNSKDGANSNFTVFKKKTLERRFGDFSCSSSIRTRKCAFHVNNIGEATQICKAYGQVCKGFVLTKESEGLISYLKHGVLRVQKSNNSALFVKNLFVSTFTELRSEPNFD